MYSNQCQPNEAFLTSTIFFTFISIGVFSSLQNITAVPGNYIWINYFIETVILLYPPIEINYSKRTAENFMLCYSLCFPVKKKSQVGVLFFFRAAFTFLLGIRVCYIDKKSMFARNKQACLKCVLISRHRYINKFYIHARTWERKRERGGWVRVTSLLLDPGTTFGVWYGRATEKGHREDLKGG